jgi:serine/threonine protein kinase
MQSYKKLSLLGYGSFGRVYLVSKDNQFYALKQIQTNSQSVIDKIINEINILKYCQHGTIPTLFYYHQKNNLYSLIMEHGGRDLYEFLNEQYYHCFSEASTKCYMSQIREGIAYLHTHGIIHRDLKLENILISNTHDIKIIDFNLSIFDTEKIETVTFIKPYSQTQSQVTRSNKILTGIYGTPEYLAPEMIQLLDYTCMIDWWSFGIIIYELLYGQTPFYHDDDEVMIAKITQGYFQLPQLTLLGEELKETTLDIIKKLLILNVNQRLGYLGGGEEIKDHPFFN